MSEITTISSLPAKTALLSSDSLAVDDGVHTYKISGEQLREFLKINSAPIGTVSFSQSRKIEDNPGRLPLFSGDTIVNADKIYPDFFNWLKAHGGLCIALTAYEDSLSKYGECPFYVINTETGSLRLPVLKNFIKAATPEGGIKSVAAGLPNITGTVLTLSGKGGSEMTGAFYDTGRKINGNAHTDNQSDPVAGFDASRSNAVYGNSDTVTPAHTTLYPWVSVVNYAVPASVAQNQALLDILLDTGGVLGRIIALEQEIAALKANTKIIAGDNVTIEEISQGTEDK